MKVAGVSGCQKLQIMFHIDFNLALGVSRNLDVDLYFCSSIMTTVITTTLPDWVLLVRVWEDVDVGGLTSAVLS